MARSTKLNVQQAGPALAPIAFAIGVAVTFAGLVVNLDVVAPTGAAIAVLAAAAWIRGNTRRPRGSTEPARSEPPAGEAERFPRSRLLERATLGLGGLVAAGVALPVIGAAVLPAFGRTKARAIDLGPIGAFPEGKFVIATFLSDPQAGEISRRAAFVRNNGFVGKSPSFTIMSSRCTHVGCPTQPNGPIFVQKETFRRTNVGEIKVVPTLPAGGFGCPCHGSQFDTEGNRTAGPAPRALDRYQFSVRNGRLILGPIDSVSRVDGAGGTARIHSFKRLGDGEPASGPESLLYPLDPIS
ncbi:MAG TPA: Rieske 2Fe-2S domain-containing protein [Gaiellaceae bacterium]